MNKHSNSQSKLAATSNDRGTHGDGESKYTITSDQEAALELPGPEDFPSIEEQFSQAHVNALILALFRGQGYFTQGQVEKLESWARRVMFDFSAMQLIFQGLLKVKLLANGDVEFDVADRNAMPGGDEPATRN